jgi:enoyl-CoA hydratase/carnithine racemase
MEIGDFQDILYEKEPETGVVTITYNRPGRKNALSLVTFLELGAALEAAAEDPEARVLILTGRGKAFSSGGYFNLNFMQSLPPELLSRIDATDIAQKKICLKFWEFDKPVIAAVNGLAIGAGFTLPLACADLIYMAEEAYVKFPVGPRSVSFRSQGRHLRPASASPQSLILRTGLKRRSPKNPIKRL